MDKRLKEIYKKLKDKFSIEEFVFYPSNTNQDVVVIFREPGRREKNGGEKEHIENYLNKVGEADNIEGEIKGYQYGFGEWMNKKILDKNNKLKENRMGKHYRAIWESLREFELINYKDGGLRRDREDFFLGKGVHKQVYITDAVKVRDKILEDEERENDNLESYFKEILWKELKLVGSEEKEKLIIAVGGTAWDKIRENEDIEDEDIEIEKTKDGPDPNSKLTEMHGHLFQLKINNKKFFVIPIAFPSRSYLRNSYKKILEEGFREI